MARNPKNRFVRSCFVAVIFVIALFLSFSLLPAAHAAEKCLRIGMPEIYTDQRGIEPYRTVMAEAGLCVQPVPMPNARSVLAIRRGDIDGLFAAVNDLPDLAGVAVVRGKVTLGNVKGLLIVRSGDIAGIGDLKDELLGIWLGETWSKDLIASYPNVIGVPRGPQMMQQMLREGRLDAMLMDAYSLKISGGVPDGYKGIPIADIVVHSWLRAEFAEFLPKLDEGTRAYQKKLLALSREP